MAHPVALSQLLLNMLTLALYRAEGGEIRFAARSLRWKAEIEVACFVAGRLPSYSFGETRRPTTWQASNRPDNSQSSAAVNW